MATPVTSTLPQPAPPAWQLHLNESPFPVPSSVRRLIIEQAARVHRYPTEADQDLLIAALAEHCQVDQDQLVIAAGSAVLLQQVVARYAKGGTVVAPWRSWEALPDIVTGQGAHWRPVPLDTVDRIDLDAVLAAIDETTRMVILTSPNNPTGATLPRAAVERFLSRLPADIVCVLDEAYHEFVTDPLAANGLRLLQRHENVIVLRTFSKAFGLAGLRIGYAIAARHRAVAWRRRQLPFHVPSITLRAATTVLNHRAEPERRIQELCTERDGLAAGLRGLGFAVPESMGNFVWLPLRDGATTFADHLAQHNVLVRAWDDDGVRITIGGRAANVAVLGAATSFHR